MKLRLLIPLIALIYAPFASADTNVLFIGNSYTQQMAEIFRFFAKQSHERGKIEVIAPGGMQLKSHWEKRDASEKISKGRWNYVILQEQSQIPSFPEAQVRSMMDPSLTEFLKVCTNAKAKPLLYCHWAKLNGDKRNNSADTYEAQRDRLQTTYTRLHQEQGITLAPVIQAWDRVRKQHPTIQLYGPDGDHPSLAGAYLAACVVHSTIYGKDATLKLPTCRGLAEADARILREAAAPAQNANP